VGLITPIFKKGNPLDCGNYREVTLGVALAKLYAAVLNNRLSNWAEKYQYRAKAQAGFRKDYRCAENLFIFRTLKEKCASQRTRLYCCFVDFLKHSIPYHELSSGKFWRTWVFMATCSKPFSYLGQFGRLHPETKGSSQL
jgi:hypothetical protein